MISKALNLIVNELNAYLDALDTQSDDLVVLGNIAQYESTSGNNGQNTLQNKIVVTLINAEVEKTLKNQPNYRKVNGSTEYKKAPLYLNLYIIISSTATLYTNAMVYLSRIIQFFHSQNSFNIKNSVINNATEARYKMDDFRLVVDLYCPSFEEINFLWSTLGGKQLPSLIYKIRLIQIESEKKMGGGELIKEVKINKTQNA